MTMTDTPPQAVAGRLSHRDEATFSIETEDRTQLPSVPERIFSADSNIQDPDIENYDTQKVDPTAVMEHSQGGGLAVQMDDTKPKLGPRRTSIPVRLEKTDRRGRYVLHADDPEIREILKEGLRRRRAPSPASTRKRNGLRELVFTRRFTAFDRQNPANVESPFHGFFTLFWLVMGSMLIRIAMLNYVKYGSILGSNELAKMMFHRDVVVLGLSDGVLYVLTGFGLILQKMIARGWLRWDKSGWIIQNIWQTLYIFGAIGWTFYREWPWTHSIFLTLHTLVYLMKQHSYAFYNGYLSQCQRRKRVLEVKLDQLRSMDTASSPMNGSKITQSFERPTSDENAMRLRRRLSKQGVTNMAKDPEEITAIANVIEAGETLDMDQLEAFERLMVTEIESLEVELRGKCSVTKNYYPKNLTVFNWAEWICFPTLVYELEYPRQDMINWWYVAEKTTATFGIIGIMMVISQAYIYPVMIHTVEMQEAGLTAVERFYEYPLIVFDMLIPLLLEHLLTWYLIWECILNVLAELTKFADRGFYGPWWNSVSFDQYARDWNRPVHNFLLRHVYHSSISALHISKTAATFVTFLLSALVHELLMFVLFKKVRGYLFWLQLSQVPLAMLSRTKFMKEKKLLGNVVFWTGLFLGPSVLTGLYLIL